MDIDLIKTFLEVKRTRHFGRAADNLYLTQSAVSARIRQLEETLGVKLFTRSRNDIQLTPAGTRLVKYAESMLNTWNRARQDAALGQEEKMSLAIGGMFSLWDILLQKWIHTLHYQYPQIALQAEAHGSEALVHKVLDGALDVAFMFEPPQMAELQVQEVAQIQLIMVSNQPGRAVKEATAEGYIMVDWGTAFAIAHAQYFPDIPPPAVRVGLGRMALAFILECGGATYLSRRMVSDYLESGRLFPVPDAPAIDRQVFAVYPQGTERRALLDEVLVLLTLEMAAAPKKRAPDAPVR